MLHGGTYIPYLDRKGMMYVLRYPELDPETKSMDSTHIIASNLTPSKFREFSKYKVVTPAWITDSVEKGTLLEWRAYKLVPKGGGEEQGMRGGMGRFLARASQAAEPKRVEKEEEETAEVLVKSDEDDVVAIPSPVKPDTPTEINAEPKPRETTIDQITSYAEPSPEPTTHAPTTPKKPTPLAPVFTKSPAPPRAKSPIEDTESLEYPPNALPPTTDQRAFDRAKAMGWYATRTENPDAKRLMKSAEWREQHTAANEGFLEGYYQNSRYVDIRHWCDSRSCCIGCTTCQIGKRNSSSWWRRHSLLPNRARRCIRSHLALNPLQKTSALPIRHCQRHKLERRPSSAKRVHRKAVGTRLSSTSTLTHSSLRAAWRRVLTCEGNP